MAGKTDRFDFSEFSVQPQVLEEIAAIAAGKVEGVAGLTGGITGRLAGRGGRGVVAARVDDHIEIEVHVVAEYARPLKELGGEVQASVTEAIESMVGKARATVHVFIDGLLFPEPAG